MTLFDTLGSMLLDVSCSLASPVLSTVKRSTALCARALHLCYDTAVINNARLDPAVPVVHSDACTLKF